MSANANTTDVPNGEATVALLNHIARYRLTIFTAISRLPEFRGRGPRQLRRLLDECAHTGLVSSALLHHGIRYWFLTPTGARQCGLDENRSGPLSETAKLRAYSLLAFSCLSARPRYRLTADDLRHQFPILYRSGMPSTYYFDPAGAGCIGLARIDAGQRGRWDRVIQSVQQDIRSHLSQPGFQQLIQARRFEITLLTVLPAKSCRMVRTLQTLPEMKHVPVHVVAQPELLPLVHSSQGKETQSRLPRHGFHRSWPRSTKKQRAKMT